MEKGLRSSYKAIGEWSAVQVKVPKDSLWGPEQKPVMQFVQAHTLELENGSSIEVEDHWRNALPPQFPDEQVLIQRNFYGFSEEDFGKKRVADIELVEKTTSNGWKVLQVNIRKTDAKPILVLKIMSEGRDGVRVFHMPQRILFEEHVRRVRTEDKVEVSA